MLNLIENSSLKGTKTLVVYILPGEKSWLQFSYWSYISLPTSKIGLNSSCRRNPAGLPYVLIQMEIIPEACKSLHQVCVKWRVSSWNGHSDTVIYQEKSTQTREITKITWASSWNRPQEPVHPCSLRTDQGFPLKHLRKKLLIRQHHIAIQLMSHSKALTHKVVLHHDNLNSFFSW